MTAAEPSPVVSSTLAGSDPWETVLDLPCTLHIELPVPQFTIRELLTLLTHSVVDTQQTDGSRVPVRVNGCLIGWGEFDVVNERLAVRLTDLA